MTNKTQRKPTEKIPKEKIKADIHRVNLTVQGPLTMEKYRKHGNYTCWPVVDRYGSWNKAKEKLGMEKVPPGDPGKITEKEILEDMKKTADETEGPLTTKKYRQNGEYSAGLVQQRIGGFNKAKKKIGLEPCNPGDVTIDENIVNFLEQYLSDKRGRFKYKDIMEQLRETPYDFRKHHFKYYLEQLNERNNGLHINRSTTGGSETRFFLNNDNVGMYDKYYEKLPEETHVVFDQVMSDESGRSPQGATAAIMYLYSEEATQAQIEEEYSASKVTIRNVAHHIKDKGYGKDVLAKLQQEDEEEE